MLADLEKLQAGEPHRLRLCSRHMRLFSYNKRSIELDERICSATTATDDVHQSLVDELSHLRRHRLGCLVIESEGVGESGIGVATDIVWCLSRQFPQIRLHLCGTKRAVEPNRENGIATDTGQKGIERLSAECTPGQVADGDREHERQFYAFLLHRTHRSIDGTLGIERIEDRLYQQGIHPTLDQTVHLFLVSLEQLIVGQFPGSRVTHVGRHRQRLVRRSDAACHKPRFLRRGVFIGQPTGYPSPFEGHLPSFMFQMIVGL